LVIARNEKWSPNPIEGENAAETWQAYQRLPADTRELKSSIARHLPG
jgi:hypothetical protein